MGVRDEAARLRKAGDYEGALLLYDQLWTAGGGRDKWDGWGYAYCLRKVGRVAEALDVCRAIYRLDAGFTFNNTLYAWCIYDTELRRLGEGATASVRAAVRAATAIVSLCRQEKRSPFVVAVLKVTRVLLAGPHACPAQALEWLERLDPALLDPAPFMAQGQGARSGPSPSYLETYHLRRASALFALDRHDACLEACREALAGIPEFHAGTDRWLRRLQAKVLVATGRLDQAKAHYDELVAAARGEAEWFLLAEAADVERQLGDLPRAWGLLVEAARRPGDVEMRVQLFRVMADVLLDMGRVADAAAHARAALAIRRDREWQVDDRLRATMARAGVTADDPGSSREALASLRRVWQADVEARFPESEGHVRTVLPNGRAGFIRGADGVDRYFRLRSARGTLASFGPGTKVRFRVRASYDAKKKRPSEEAFDVRPTA